MPERVLVIDIGKTNAKAAVVETAGLAQIDFLARPSRGLGVVSGGDGVGARVLVVQDREREGAAGVEQRDGGAVGGDRDRIDPVPGV